MRSIAAVLVGLECALAVSAASLPRGVGPEFAKFYEDQTTFKCISNPTISLPLARFNDDYCDCPDGSDEPGTAACAHLSPLSPKTAVDIDASGKNVSAALPGFYCENKRHIPGYVPFTNVNDGICDYELCCDGTEEWQGVGGVKCQNRCDEIGKQWRIKDNARKAAASKAAAKRKELAEKATSLRTALQDKLQSLTAEIEASEKKVKQLEAELAETEKSEAGKVIKAGKTGGKMGTLVTLAKARTEELRQALTEMNLRHAFRQNRLEELEKIMATFKEEYNPNFNDEGVKRAVRAWDDFVANKPADIPSFVSRDIEEIVKSDSDNGINWEEFESGEEESDETAVLYAFENYLPPSLRTWVDAKIRELRTLLVQNGILAENSHGSSSESKAVTAARTKLDAGRRDVEAQRKSLRETEEDLQKDFGPDDIFRALKGVCVETDSGEYTYELCFLDRTTQKPKKGGAHTNMGTYTRLERIVVDEELPADGRGLGAGERFAMKHENGQHCWNGPHRSTTVVLACAEHNEIWKIMEEEKCVYRMEVGTPAVCEPVAEDKPARDEL